MTEEPIRAAVLLNSESVNEWQRRALTSLFESGEIDVNLVTVIINSADTGNSTIRTHLSEFSLWKVLRVFHLLKYQLAGQPWHKKRTALSDIDFFDDSDKIYSRPQPTDELGNELSSEAVECLGKTDIAIRFGFGIVVGDALTAPTYGMLSYHHGDLRRYRGRPAGFHEFARGEPTAGVTVQNLNESLDGGDIAAFGEVDIHDATSWPAVLSRLYEASPDLLPIAVTNCVTGDLKTDPDTGGLYTIPSTRETLMYLREKLKRYSER
jgi:folate-dependent phosphoribosylglycinamide formyltransferase PurN